jgi:uncharacterized damage-inducible protein DinB
MNALDILRRQAANNAWSNLRLHRACARLSQEEWQATRTSFFPSLPETLNHILVVDWYYVDALENGGRGLACFETMMPFADSASLAAAQAEVDRRLVAFTRSLKSEADLEAEVRMQRSKHVQVDNVGNVLLHLNVHQVHHRGQAHAMLSGTSVKPPQLDEFFMAGELHLREEELRRLGLPLE